MGVDRRDGFEGGFTGSGGLLDGEKERVLPVLEKSNWGC